MSHSPSHPSGLIGLRELYMLRPEVAFLNHGSFGACPRAVMDVYQAWQIELERQPVEFFQRRSEALLRDARAELGRFVGADADDLVYTTNVTMAINIVAHSVPLGPGDEVLTTDQEYGAIDNVWRAACARHGAGYIQREVPLPTDSAEEIVEAVWAGVTDRTRVLALSHITSGTAVILPVEALVRRAREAGIITVIDGAHAAGQLPIDMEAIGADFYAASCHKWMMAPKGTGFLYARRPMQEMLEALVISFGSRPGEDRSRFVDEQQRQGTRDLSAFLSVPAAIAFAAEHRWPQVQDACHDLLCEARRRIAALTGLSALTPDACDWFAQMATAPIPACDGAALHKRLYDEYAIEIPITRHKDQPLLRISIQGYNSGEDIDRLMAALQALLPEVAT